MEKEEAEVVGLVGTLLLNEARWREDFWTSQIESLEREIEELKATIRKLRPAAVRFWAIQDALSYNPDEIGEL